MSSQNYLNIAIEKLGSVMLDDRRKKAADICKSAIKRHKREDYNPPAYNEDKISIRSMFVKGGLCFCVAPSGASVKDYFFFLHGGGFISQITHHEWRFVFDTVERTGYSAVIPVYPVAPEHSVLEAVDMLLDAYDKVCSREDVDRIVLVGNSSGGCLALTVAIQLWKTGGRRPDKIVLASPVLDIEFSDPDMVKLLENRKKFAYRYYYTDEIGKFLSDRFADIPAQ